MNDRNSVRRWLLLGNPLHLCPTTEACDFGRDVVNKETQ
jgi:hypothetical protein